MSVSYYSTFSSSVLMKGLGIPWGFHPTPRLFAAAVVVNNSLALMLKNLGRIFTTAAPVAHFQIINPAVGRVPFHAANKG